MLAKAQNHFSLIPAYVAQRRRALLVSWRQHVSHTRAVLTASFHLDSSACLECILLLKRDRSQLRALFPLWHHEWKISHVGIHPPPACAGTQVTTHTDHMLAAATPNPACKTTQFPTVQCNHTFKSETTSPALWAQYSAKLHANGK